VIFVSFVVKTAGAADSELNNLHSALKNAGLHRGRHGLKSGHGYFEDCFRRLEWRALYEFRPTASG
jgi:hypothetical protein